MKRSVFSYPYIIFAIVFIFAPLVLIFIYSITLPVTAVSAARGEEMLKDDFVSRLTYVGYTEDAGLSVPGTWFSEGDSVTVRSYIFKRTEIYRLTFSGGIVSAAEELNGDGTVFDPNVTSMRFDNIKTGFTFTLDHFKKFFSSGVYMTVLLRSLYIAFVSTVICLLIGFPTAYALTLMKKKNRGFISMLFILPMWMNFLLRTYAWRTILENNGILNNILERFGLPTQSMMYSKSAIILCMIYNFLPFMIMPIYNTISKIDVSLIEASQDLGANSYVTIFRLILPLSVPGIVSGITMTFIPSVTAFAISKILGGTDTTMIGEIIEREFNYDYWFGSAISVIIMVMLLLSMAVFSRYDKEENVGGGLI